MAAAPRLGPLAWPALAAGLAAGALLLSSVPRGSLDWQPGLAATQPWRLWTAALTHLTSSHLAANVVGCGVVGAFGWAARAGGTSALAWALAWPLTHLGLAAVPRLERCAGMSGVLHAGVVIAALHLLTQHAARERAIGAGVIAGVVAKLSFERAWETPLRQTAAWDFPVATAVHLTGALAGLAVGAVALAVLWAVRRRQAGAGGADAANSSLRNSSLR